MADGHIAQLSFVGAQIDGIESPSVCLTDRTCSPVCVHRPFRYGGEVVSISVACGGDGHAEVLVGIVLILRLSIETDTAAQHDLWRYQIVVRCERLMIEITLRNHKITGIIGIVIKF